MLGALVRVAHTAMIGEYSRWLASSPYTDIQPAHAAAIQPLWQLPEGARLTTLARMAGMTKQSMGALVDALEHGGYVERVDDPDDRRASRVRLTARGGWTISAPRSDSSSTPCDILPEARVAPHVRSSAVHRREYNAAALSSG